MSTIIFGIFTFIAGALLSGKVASAWGGLKTDVAMMKVRLGNLEAEAKAKIAALESKLP